jgi:hypothetical protein
MPRAGSPPAAGAITAGEIVKLVRHLLPVVAMLFMLPAFAGEPLSASDTEFAAAFRCPETLANDAERNQANDQFSAWLHNHHPNWSLQQVLQFRAELLSEHHCQTALTQVPEPPAGAAH